LGETDAALEEYARLIKFFSGAEALCRYAMLLKRIGREQEAKTIFEKIVKDARLSPKFYQKEQKEWINMARKEI
jgi:hypothetical protein